MPIEKNPTIICSCCQKPTRQYKWTQTHYSGVQRWKCTNEGCGKIFISNEDKQATKQRRFDRNVQRLIPVLALLGLRFDTKQAERVTGFNWDSAAKTLKSLLLQEDRYFQVMAEAEELLERTKGVHTTNLGQLFYDWAAGYGKLMPDEKLLSQRRIRQLRQTDAGKRQVEQLEKDACQVTGLDLLIDNKGRLRLKVNDDRRLIL